jgi:E3 ubiquitin-protein ligase HERC3
LHIADPLCICCALQLLEQILGYCGPRELGCLEATCSYFVKGGITDKVAKAFLRDIPRAKGLKPDLK